MTRNQTAILTFERWWQEWGDPGRELTFNEAKEALEELERLVERYFSM